jgi:ferredoxin-NADP reductase/MOSC domain-containing protein YiiM/ferredoxin
MVGRLRSVNVGLPREIAWRGETVRTAVWKQPVQGRQTVRRLNIMGDGQADLASHGGEHRAVFVYQLDSYLYWEGQLGRSDLSLGQFGENFTVEGLPDDEVRIGDRYRVGTALFEVTQPRVTCYRVGIRMAEPAMAALLVSHHRPGFYLRVLEEGEVGAGDEIIKVTEGPEPITVAAIDALLYLPNRPREQLASSLRIPALSPGWKTSLQTLLDEDATSTGNPGRTNAAGAPPAWSGFRPMQVTKVNRESASVVSLSFEPLDGTLLPAASPGQFVVLRLRVAPDLPPILRNYSMSGKPGANYYRVSVKREPHGVGSAFLHDQVGIGDVVEVSAPRGTFILTSGETPIVLVSAGIGATPVLAMLHSLVSDASPREVWWLYGARNRTEHPFAKESRELLQTLARARSYIVYSKPRPQDQQGTDYDSPGYIDTPLLDRLGLNPNSDFYLCGPPSFLRNLNQGLRNWGAPPAGVHQEVFGPEDAITPGIATTIRARPHTPEGTPGHGPQVSFTRSGLTAPWNPRFSNLLEFAEACEVPVKWSCRTGVCHTCESALIGGAVTYDPEPLEPPSEGNLLICCSRPSGDLEVDL